MINVGMREEDGVNFLWIEAEIPIAALCLLPPSLKESAVQEHTIPVGLNQVSAPSDRSNSAVEGEFHRNQRGGGGRRRNVCCFRAMIFQASSAVSA